MPFGLTRKQIAILGIGLVLVVGGYFLIFYKGSKPPPPPEVTLTVWGPLDDTRVFGETLTAQYQAIRPNVKISYRAISAAKYDETLLNALAAGTGPDIFLISNRAVDKRLPFLVPIPPTMISPTRLEALFPTVVGQDFIRNGQIYALPVSMDTLALIYNKDAFDRALIAQPPTTWVEFQNIIPYLRTSNEAGQLVRAAAAIGGSEKTVENATDLVQLLMMQNGAPMVNANSTRLDLTGAQNSGPTALNFYLQFANAASRYYTWNDAQSTSFDSIGSGRTAMVFGYAADLATLRRKNPLMNFGVAAMPQIAADQTMNAARYWGLGVSKQSQNGAWAWEFISTVATNEKAAQAFTDATKRLPALRTLITQKYEDPDLGVFAREALTARGWRQPDDAPVRKIFNDALAGVLSGQFDSTQALRQMTDQTAQLMIGGQ